MIDQAVKGGFRFRNVEEEEVVKTAPFTGGFVDPTVVESVQRQIENERESGSIKKEESEVYENSV